MTRWEILDKENILNTKWIVVEKHKCKINKDLIINDFYIVKKGDFVVIVVEGDGYIYFLKQYRHGIGEHIINLPMGIVDGNENPIETARRELLEETGYKVQNLEYLGEFYMAPSYISTKAYVFYAKDPISEINEEIDDNEGELILIKVSKNELKEKIRNNEIKDMASIMALYIAGEKLNLF